MDQSAIDGLTEHVAALRRYAFALTASRLEAEDLVQETLMRAIAGARSFQRGGNLRAWLFSIMHNAFVSTMRRRRQVETGGEDELLERGQPPDQVIKLEVRDVLAALARLPEPQRAAISLIALEEFSYREAASILGIPVGTLMSRLARGREALRRLLDDQPHPALQVIGERR